MEFIQLFATDTDREDNDIATAETDEVVDLGDFINDPSSSSFQENSFIEQ